MARRSKKDNTYNPLGLLMVKEFDNKAKKHKILVEFDFYGNQITPPKKVSWVDYIIDLQLYLLSNGLDVYDYKGRKIFGNEFMQLKSTLIGLFNTLVSNEKNANKLLKEYYTHEADNQANLQFFTNCIVFRDHSMITAVMASIAPQIILTEWQSGTANTWHKISVNDGGRGVGRSTEEILRLIAVCLMYPGLSAAVTRKTKVSNRDSTFKDVVNMLTNHPVLSQVTHIDRGRMIVSITIPNPDKNSTTKELTSQVFFCGVKDDTQRLQLRGIGPKDKLGGQIDYILAEEAVGMIITDFNLFMSSLRGKTMGDGKAQLRVNTNPGAPTHWIYQKLVLGGYVRDMIKPSDNLSKEQIEERVNQVIKRNFGTAKDNEYLPSDYVENNLESLTGNDKKRDADGIWSRAEGLAFPSWDNEKNIINYSSSDNPLANWLFIQRETLKADAKIVVTIDWGATGVTAVKWAIVRKINEGKLNGKNKLTVYRELHQYGLDSNKVVDIIRHFPDCKNIILIVAGHDKPNEITVMKRAFKNDKAKVYSNAEYFSKKHGYNRAGGGYLVDAKSKLDQYLSNGRYEYLDGSLIGYNDKRTSLDVYNQYKRDLKGDSSQEAINLLSTLLDIHNQALEVKNYMVSPKDFDHDGRRFDGSDKVGGVYAPRGFVEEINSLVEGCEDNNHSIDCALYQALALSMSDAKK